MPGTDDMEGGRIVLVGMMGAGKSSVGRLLAERLGLAFADADEEIEREAGQSIQGLFEREGEAAFRERERRAMRRLIEGPARVIAAGGGAFLDEAVRTAVLERCTAIWLDAEPELLVRRLDGARQRPLLGGRDPLAQLTGLRGERERDYARAHVRVAARDEPIEATVERVIGALKERAS